MKSIAFLLTFLLFLSLSSQGQEDSLLITRADTLPIKDTAAKRDSADIVIKPAKPAKAVIPIDTPVSQKPYVIEIVKRPLIREEWKLDSSKRWDRQVLQHHPYFGFGKEAVVVHSEIRSYPGKELLFYSILFILILYALLRKAFPKYFNDLYRLFFRTTIKQRQIKEQLIQTPLPSILLNIFFVISAGLYVTFLVEHYKVNPTENFWLLFFYSVIGLTGIYLVKWLGLKLTGWVFGMRDAADSYIFIVFIINKMAGVFLLPFLVLLAFTSGNIHSTAMVLSFIVLAALLAYRFILTYTVVRNQVKVNLFQFFLYLCAFEIAPLLLVYKLLLIYFRISA